MRVLESGIKSVNKNIAYIVFCAFILIQISCLFSYFSGSENSALRLILSLLPVGIFPLTYAVIRIFVQKSFRRISDEVRAHERVSSALIGLLHSTGGIASLSTYNQLISSNIDNPQMVEELLVQESLLINEYTEKTKSLLSDISGSFKFEKQKTELNELVEQSLNFIRAKRIREKKVHIRFDKCETSIYSLVSPAEIKTAIETILDNSFDELIHSDQRKKTVSISVERSGESAFISITDNGRGIPGQNGKVDPTYFKPGKSSKKTGNGLGMYSSINSIINNGGTIGFFSSSSGFETRIRLSGV